MHIDQTKICFRIYSSGLSRESANPSVGRFTMLEHHHSWSFDPSNRIRISVGDSIFREVRQKYKLNRDDELGSKPNDWKRDGYREAQYNVVNATEEDEYLHLCVDPSRTRMKNISIELIGQNSVQVQFDFEANRLKKTSGCILLKTEGYLPLNNTVIHGEDYETIELAGNACILNIDCYGVSTNGTTYVLHTETPLLRRVWTF